MSPLFFEITVSDAVRTDRSLAEKLESACPVDIYRATKDGTVEVVEENVDECVLCRLCLQAAPPGAIEIARLYGDRDPV